MNNSEETKPIVGKILEVRTTEDGDYDWAPNCWEGVYFIVQRVRPPKSTDHGNEKRTTNSAALCAYSMFAIATKLKQNNVNIITIIIYILRLFRNMWT